MLRNARSALQQASRFRQGIEAVDGLASNAEKIERYVVDAIYVYKAKEVSDIRTLELCRDVERVLRIVVFFSRRRLAVEGGRSVSTLAGEWF